MNILDEIDLRLQQIESKIDKIESLILSQGERLLSVKELAELLNCSTSDIYARVRLNLIPHYKIGSSLRFKRSEIDDFIKREVKIS